VRAWTIHAGDTAPKAAGVIHSDFERGFIKAETVAYDALIKCGSVAAAREKGLYRMEGKEYVVKDGDVLLFKFNVLPLACFCQNSQPGRCPRRSGSGWHCGGGRHPTVLASVCLPQSLRPPSHGRCR
jgi:hypothetical protein